MLSRILSFPVDLADWVNCPTETSEEGMSVQLSAVQLTFMQKETSFE